MEADGNVVLRRAGLAVFGDQLRYLLPTNNVTITGHVRFDRQDIITGDYASFDLDEETATSIPRTIISGNIIPEAEQQAHREGPRPLPGHPRYLYELRCRQ